MTGCRLSEATRNAGASVIRAKSQASNSAISKCRGLGSKTRIFFVGVLVGARTFPWIVGIGLAIVTPVLASRLDA
jgi:hypothetical protein